MAEAHRVLKETFGYEQFNKGEPHTTHVHFASHTDTAPPHRTHTRAYRQEQNMTHTRTRAHAHQSHIY